MGIALIMQGSLIYKKLNSLFLFKSQSKSGFTQPLRARWSCRGFTTKSVFILATGVNAPRPKAGFTLIEVMVASGLFIIIVLIAIDIMIGVLNAQVKVSNIQGVRDAIRFSLELMTKELRTGIKYQASTFCGVAGSEINFDGTSGHRLYYLNTATHMIMRIDDGSNICANAKPFTPEEINVNSLNFALHGQAVGPNDGQPVVTINLKVSSTNPRYGQETNMALQTTVEQRLRDFY